VTYDLAIHYPNGKTQTLPDPVIVIDRPRSIRARCCFRRESSALTPIRGIWRASTVSRSLCTTTSAGTTATKSASVRVSDTNAPLAAAANYDPVSLLGDYYQRPRPRLALPNAHGSQPHASRAEEDRPPGSTARVLRTGAGRQSVVAPPVQGPVLPPPTDEGERRLFALVLAYARRDQPTFGDDLPPPARTALIAARAEPLPVPSSEPMKGGQLDALWGCFFRQRPFRADHQARHHRAKLSALPRPARKVQTAHGQTPNARTRNLQGCDPGLRLVVSLAATPNSNKARARLPARPAAIGRDVSRNENGASSRS